MLSAASLDSKIKHNKKQLSAKKIQYKKMDKQLSSVARKIISAKKEQKNLVQKLTQLEKNIKNNETKFVELRKKEKNLGGKLGEINDKIDLKEKVFLDLVAKNFSLALALEELDKPTPDSVIMKEVYELYAKNNNRDIDVLKKEIEGLKGKKSILKNQQANIQKAIHKYTSNRKDYESKKKKQDKLVKVLARDKAIYKKRFYRIKASRKSLERKLSKLKIIKRNNVKAAKAKAAEKRLALKSKMDKKGHTTPKVTTSSGTVKYTGGKTISPLKGARLIKKFGTYIDPIYKFKIFNKSITLKAPYAGSKVRSVLPGKVVFAENSGGMLGKVVIVEHSNSMHTIYAKLSRLAPGIRVGKRLSRGTIIGKVDKSLMFEVTKNNKHINPITLIRL
jgi:septal ring factor EnvC (AmiA/AmiB activator)